MRRSRFSKTMPCNGPIYLCISVFLIYGCMTARHRLASGVSSAEPTADAANNGFRDGMVEWLAGLPFSFIEVLIED
jgi:hypothetical protein